LAESSDTQLATWKVKSQLLKEKLAQLQAADSAVRLQEVLQNRIDDITDLTANVENILSADATLVNTLQVRIDRLSGLHEKLSKAIAGATERVERKSRWLEYLRSPFAPQSIYSFLIYTGPRILFTILLLFLIWAGARWLTLRILKGVVRSSSKQDREERVETLSRAIRSGLTVIIVFIGFIVLLSELGINVSVLLGGAAVFSLAIAFGMQSLVKDYFSGFMILTENQYRVGNVIRINDVSGVVEDISLRSTILRDLEGVAHFIPHSEITIVSNLTHSWSRVALDIGVAYKENVDHVMEVIMEVARGMQEDPEYSKLITDEPEMLGVDALADSAVVIRLLVKTRPTKQWIIKRELLRRLKNRFDELSIEIPFPHRTVYHKDLIIQELEKGQPKAKDKAHPVKVDGK
jgi:small conductance mechanosensitive channel